MATCISGDYCDEPAVESSTFPGIFRFCVTHQGRLDVLKEHMSDQNWAKNVRNKAVTSERFCAASGCEGRPIYGSDYCVDCVGGDD